MAYDSQIPLPQGATKVSEIFTDRAQPILSTRVGESGITVLEQLVSMNADAMRRQSYLLNSSGNITWTGTSIFFNADAQANNAVLKLLQTDDPTYRTVNLILQGTTGANDATHFNNIAMANGDLLYLEIDWAVIQPLLAGAAGNIILNNAVGGGSVTTGYTVRKINLSSNTVGMPQLNKVLFGAAGSTTFFIPLAWRNDVTVGLNTFENVYWIPHGIRWPQGVSSQLGAVIVQGFDTYPEYFITSQADLLSAITILSGGEGGVLLVTQPFSITQSIAMPDNVLLLGRSPNKNFINFTTGGSLVLGNFVQLKDLGFSCAGNFGTTSTEYMVQPSGNNSMISNCSFNLTPVPAWSSGPTYVIGNIVQYLGIFYASIANANTNFQPDINPSKWTPFSAYNSLSTYATGAIVSWQGSTYQSLQNANTGNQPDTSPLFWSVLPRAVGIGFTGSYNKARDCRFLTVNGSPTANGLLYVSGNNNTDFDAYFT